MFFSAEDDDQDFMSAGTGSRLGSLFGIDKASSQGGNESLTYTAPKQPKPKEPSTGSVEGQPAVLFASAVNAYKYVDGKYASQGKLGAAILANHAAQDYRVLLYVSKQQQVTHAKITTAFTFTIQPNNYAIMYDDSRQTWSLLFDSEQSLQQFAKYIGLVKALSAGSGLDTVVSQDLSIGEGTSTETGSSVEVKYTGWLLTNNTFGQEFDSNVKSDKMFRFQIGKGKVIKGWDTGVVGMKKGTTRILVVPPSLGYGSKGAGNKIPPNSTLIFEIEIMRIKGAKGASPSPSPAPEPVNETTPSPGPDEEHTVKERTKSISDQLSSNPGKSGKARLISKMAKMGQPILPMSGATPADAEDDTGDEEEGSNEPPSPQPIAESPPHHHATKPKFVKPKPLHSHATQPMVHPGTQHYVQQQHAMSHSQPEFVTNLPGAQQIAVFQPQQPGYGQPHFQTQPQPAMGQYPQGQPPMYNAPYQQAPADTQILPVLTENRQQTTELRISMGKVSDKVDRIFEKVEFLQNQQSGQLSLQSSQPNMEASVLMHNVQRIVQENDRLRKEGYEKSSKIESLNNKISELLQTNQQYVEKSQNLLEQRNEGFLSTASQSQARVLALEQEKVKLTTELANATALYSDLQMELTNLRKREIEFQQKIGMSSNDTVKLQEELEALKSQKIDDSQKISELSTNVKEEKQRRKHLEGKLTQMQEEFNDITSTKEALEKNLNDRKKKAAEEKRTMEEEFEENKEQLEREVQSLKEKLRKAKTSTNVATAEQVSQVEEELNREWKEKCEKLVTAQQEKHKRALQEVKQENEELTNTVQQLEKRIQDMKSSSGSTESQIAELNEQIEEMSVWKDKYDNLRNQATAMKDKYEDRISELEGERDKLEEERDKAMEHAQKQVPSGGDSSNQSVIGEIKKIMNSVYQELKSKFEADNTYSGTDVLTAILSSIKSTTLKLVQNQEQKQTTAEESDEESEEDEEEEESEEEGEDKVDEDDKKVQEKVDKIEVTKLSAPEESPLQDDSMPSDSEDDSVNMSQSDTPSTNENIQEDSSVEQSANENTQTIPNVSPDVIGENEDKNSNINQSEPSIVVAANGIPENNVVENEQLEENDVDNKLEVKVAEDQDKNRTNDMENETTNQNIETKNNVEENVEPEIQNDNKESEKQEIKEDYPTKSSKIDISDFDIPKIEKNGSKKNEVPPAAVSMEPPPLFDDEESDKEANSNSLFGDDSHVEDTLGISFKKEETKNNKKKPSKVDLLDDDMKPQPPPPLFGEDDDDDDLDWLS